MNDQSSQIRKAINSALTGHHLSDSRTHNLIYTLCYPGQLIDKCYSCPSTARNSDHNYLETKDTFDTSFATYSLPWETSIESFISTRFAESKMRAMLSTHPTVRGRAPLSPPVSPEFGNILPNKVANHVRDPILYHVKPASPGNSFFPIDPDAHRAVEYHVATRASSVFRILSPPEMNDYTLALEFKSHMGKAFNANRRKWAQRELAQLKEDNLMRSGGIRRYQRSAVTACSELRSSMKKSSIARSTCHNSASTTKSTKAPRIKRVTGRAQTPDNGKKVVREDKDFDSLPDYSPPLSSLPNKINSLKVDWKGAPIDLKSDPFAHLLHPDEVQLAANLRLDCATYLTSKRRIFISRIAASKVGKKFRKTDAQQACKIDVNKASKLWQAFDKVGWLNVKWILDYVEPH